MPGVTGDEGTGWDGMSDENVEEVGVGERFGPRGVRDMERLGWLVRWFYNSGQELTLLN